MSSPAIHDAPIPFGLHPDQARSLRAVLTSTTLSEAARLVWAYLATWARAGEAWPSRKRIAEELGRSESSVYEALAELRAAGFVVDRGRSSRGTRIVELVPRPPPRLVSSGGRRRHVRTSAAAECDSSAGAETRNSQGAKQYPPTPRSARAGGGAGRVSSRSPNREGPGALVVDYRASTTTAAQGARPDAAAASSHSAPVTRVHELAAAVADAWPEVPHEHRAGELLRCIERWKQPLPANELALRTWCRERLMVARKQLERHGAGFDHRRLELPATDEERARARARDDKLAARLAQRPTDEDREAAGDGFALVRRSLRGAS